MSGSIRIGSLASRTGCNIETIRYYERIGLLPKPQRSAGGYRLYEEEHVRRLQFVRRARTMGFHLTDIVTLLALGDTGSKTCNKARSMAQHHLTEVRAQIAELQAIEATLAEAIERCDSGGEQRCPVVTTLAGCGSGQTPAAGDPRSP
jgi:MerR family mercuric resistance operon transcriptional regulator